MSKRLVRIVLTGVAGLFLMGARARKKAKEAPPPPGLTVEMLDQMSPLPGDLGPLPVVPNAGESVRHWRAKVELGKRLFFDKRLSKNDTISCATCHDPAKGYADGLPRATGFGGQELGRHSPTVLNAAYNDPQFWDGRAQGLEEQAKGPITATGEMNMGGEKEIMRRFRKIPEYKAPFQKIYGRGADLAGIADAIAAFERTLVTPGARFDRYAAGDKKALSVQEKRGLALYVGKANCALCHLGPNFTDNKFHNLGVPQAGPNATDDGRFAVSKDAADRRAFKTPTLRNVALTAPYMHDGVHKTLEEVVDFYDKGGGEGAGKSPLIFPLGLTAREKKDLVVFLKALTGDMPSFEMPEYR